MAPETRTPAGGATEHLLRLLEVLQYEDKPITVLEAAGETWVAATEIGRALGLHDNTVRQVVKKNPDIFESLTTTLEAIWREGATTPRGGQVETGTPASVRMQDQANTLFLNYSGVVAVLLKLDTSRIKDPEARARVVRFFRWALKDLRQAMQGRGLPAGPSAAGAPSLLPPKYLPAYRAFLCHVKDMPTPLLVQAAAAFGITLDPAAVEAERAAMARPGRSGAPVVLAAVGEQPTSAAPEDPAEKGARYLSALRRVVAANATRIAGLEARGKDGSVVVPRQGYIGGVGRAYGVEVVGIQPRALQALLAPVLGQYNARDFLAAMEKHVVAVPDPDAPEGRGVRRVPVLVTPSDERARRGKALSLRYRRADGQDIYATHLCFRRDAVLGDGTAAGGGAR